MNDPIVAETRRAGEELFARFDGDMHKVCEFLRAREKEENRKPTTLPPNRPDGWNQPTKKVG